MSLKVKVTHGMTSRFVWIGAEQIICLTRLVEDGCLMVVSSDAELTGTVRDFQESTQPTKSCPIFTVDLGTADSHHRELGARRTLGEQRDTENINKAARVEATRKDIPIEQGDNPVPPLNKDAKFFQFSAEYNTMLGLHPSDPPLRIYMRDENLQIARQLDQFVTSEDLLFTLQGPPGVGKTKESIIWMLQSMVNDFEAEVCETKDSEAEDSKIPWAWIPLKKSGGTAMGQSTVYLLGRSDTIPNAVRYTECSAPLSLPKNLCNWGGTNAVNASSVTVNIDDPNNGLVDRRERMRQTAPNRQQTPSAQK